MWYINMCCINNSISCLEKKTTFGTHEHTCYVDFNSTLCKISFKVHNVVSFVVETSRANS